MRKLTTNGKISIYKLDKNEGFRKSSKFAVINVQTEKYLGNNISVDNMDYECKTLEEARHYMYIWSEIV